MHTLSAKIDAHIDQEAVLTAVLEALPEGSTARIDQEPTILAGADLDDTHIGTTIRAQVGKDAEFAGVIEHVYPGEQGGHLLIVDGKPRTVNHYEVVQITPPYTEGAHTADEPEPVVEETFDMTADDYNSAFDLVLQVTEAVANYLTPVALLSRVAVETIAERPVTDEEYLVVARATSDQLEDMITPVAATIIKNNLALYREYIETVEGEPNA